MERNENAEKNKNQHIDDFYIRFKDKLEKGHSFPSDYTFKFIIPSDSNTIEFDDYLSVSYERAIFTR